MFSDQVLAQTFAQEETHTIIFDVDGTLFPPFLGYAERFSIETARAAKIMAGKKINEGSDDFRLVYLIATDEDDLVAEAIQSYAEYGLTTEIFALKYGLNREELYKAHHYLIAQNMIIPEFAKFCDPILQAGMAALSQTDLSLIAFTDGTEFHARKVMQILELNQYFNGISGIDTHRDKNYALKKQRAAWVDFLQHHRISSDTGYEIGQTNRVMTHEDCHWSGVLFIDDSPEKLEAAHHFGIRTILMKTDRVTYDAAAMPYIDGVIDDLGAFTNAFAKARGYVASSQSPVMQQQPKLWLVKK